MKTLRQALINAFGPQVVSLDPADLEGHSWDALRPTRGFAGVDQISRQPLAVIRPASAEEVVAAVCLATTEGVAVIPYGGGSGLMGGVVPVRPSLIIDLSALNKVLEISPENRTVRVQAGALLAQVEEQLNRKGLMLGHDPWSLPIATVGGTISTNSLGYRGSKYGSMGDQVLGLTVVLADGRIVRTRAIPKSSTGFDLKQLFIGSEGCFGIIIEAVLRVFPLPEKRVHQAYTFSSFEPGLAAIQALYGLGLVPALVDYGESFAPAPIRKFMRQWGRRDRDPTLYLTFEGFQEEVEAQNQRAHSICQDQGGQDLGYPEAQRFWDERHAVAERYSRGRFAPLGEEAARRAEFCFDYVHVALPVSLTLEYRRRCQEIARRHRVYTLEYGIWCWPELFSTVMAKASVGGHGATRALGRAVDEMLMLAQDLGGSMEYCHGVGLRLAHLMEREYGEGLAVLRAIKGALDPQGLLNPDKLGL